MDDFPIAQRDFKVKEPMVDATIISPVEYTGVLLELLQEKRGVKIELRYIDDNRVDMLYKLPWQEVVTDFYDELKSASSGYATLSYKEIEPEVSDIVKVDILINGSPMDAMSFACHRSKVQLKNYTSNFFRDLESETPFF